MVTCSVCEHRAHEGVCVTCIEEFEVGTRTQAEVCVTPISPMWIANLPK